MLALLPDNAIHMYRHRKFKIKVGWGKCPGRGDKKMAGILTERQKQILDYITSYLGQTGRPPTAREICRAFGFASPRAATDHIKALVRKGYLQHYPGSARGIRPCVPEAGGIPILGRVAAGLPIEAVEHCEGHLAPGEWFSGPGIFSVKVQGESMKDAGILDGDYVIVRQSPFVQDGAIGVAYLDGDATVKRIYRTGKGFRLEPANEAFKPMIIEGNSSEFRIGGAVIAVLRRVTS